MFKTANLLLLDGCSVDCGKKILDKAGITNYQYLRLTVKGQTPVTDEVIKAVYEKAEVL